jgi:PAS domain S-box-containing protein
MGNHQGGLSAVKARAYPDAKRGRVHPKNPFATAVFVKDRQHRCVMLNDECCRLLGHARQFLIGKTDYDFLPKDQADKIWEMEEHIFMTGHGVYDEESHADRKGATRAYSTTKTLFTDRSGGAWLVGVIDDITVHARVLADCRYMESLLEAQNEASIEGILVVDGSARIVATNRRFGEMWGISPEIMASKSDAVAREAVWDKIVDPAGFRKRVDSLYRHRDEKSHDEILLRDGRIFDRYTAPVVGEEGFYYGRVWYFRDVTDSRRCADLGAEVKQRRELDALKDQFIGTVSHELRTPLTVVRTAVDSLRDGMVGALSPKQREVADLCHRNVLRLCKMITNLLDISRLESGHAKARLESLDLKPLLTDLEANFRLMGLGRKISIKIDAPAAPPLVRGDPELIGEVLSNLLDNAARFARREVRVKVSRESAAAAGRETKGVRVEVIDDGPGIPAGRIGELFNKFTQVQRSVGAGYKGTGLGLAICKEIMKLHGSSIAVESSPGRGARFHFFLPEWTKSPVPAVRAASGRGRT